MLYKNMLYVDIDGVIADLTEPLLRYVSHITGVNTDNFEIHRYDFFDDLSDYVGTDVNEIVKSFANSEYLTQIRPIEGYKCLNYLYDFFDVTLITARPDKCIEYTKQWLDENYILHDKLMFNKDKLAAIKKDKRAKCLVEDNGDTALKVAEVVPVLLLDKSYNKFADHQNITRVADWNEIRELLL